MQKNNYLGVGIMAKKTKFNRFFEYRSIKNIYHEFKGLCFLYEWLDTNKVYENQREKYKLVPCGNNPIKAILFGPMAIGAVLSLLLLIACVVATYSS